MTQQHHFKPSHQPIKEYYAALQDYAGHEVVHELAVKTAFQRLLEVTARKHDWHLVPEQPTTVRGKSIRPDGTLRDSFNLHRGYWEAKDSGDRLDVEIKKKIKSGYPLMNTIFEDTRWAALYQNGQEVEPRFDLTQPQHLCDLLNQFYSHAEPDIEGFEQAVGQFKERVPELALGLKAKIEDAHRTNRQFQEAFEKFFDLCRQSLNPNLSVAAVDEMLIQHLLTERLIRTVFDREDFVRRNVIAAEVEKVIDALTSRSFSRQEFLKSLDRFYVAIESAAAVLEDFSEKQHFLNTVYERFFQGYSVKTADTHGIVYTPQEIVDFMCASVAEVLDKEFGKTLGSPDVNILDPCTGTGNFIVNLIRRVPKRDLQRVYAKQLFANEVMLLPYYIAALNIEHAFFEMKGEYEPFEGLCFVDTLDLTDARQVTFEFMTEENTQRVERQKNTPITVIVGNPPYNANQIDENDNNKNRKYNVIDGRIKRTYAADSTATLKNKLYDSYVKFIRWATDRLGGRDGILCYVTNNSFVVDGPPFDGMRKHMIDDFTRIHHIDLHGNVRQNPRLSGTTHNVFGIQVGVGITLAVRCSSHKRRSIHYHRVPEDWRKEEKLSWLSNMAAMSAVSWKTSKPSADHQWVATPHGEEYSSFLAMGEDDEEGVFRKHSTGAKSNRDDIVYDFSKDALRDRIANFATHYNSEVDRYKREYRSGDIDEFLQTEHVQWSSTLKLHLQRGRYANVDEVLLRSSLYRPFSKQALFYDGTLNDRPGIFRNALPNAEAEEDNRVICCANHSQIPFVALACNAIANEAVGGRAGQCFPFYLYDIDGTNRRENITDWALAQFREHYSNKRITKWDVFYYVYGVLHHPGYRKKFADNLKRELPRIPLAPDFKAFAAAGKKLADLHLNYESLEPWPLDWIEAEGVPLSYRVEKMRLSKDKTRLAVNDSLTLAAIPPETFNYRLGNRSALDWVVDQYRVKTDKRSGIVSDPNNPDDPEYIVRLVGQVVRVSVETVKIVAALPTEYAGKA